MKKNFILAIVGTTLLFSESTNISGVDISTQQDYNVTVYGSKFTGNIQACPKITRVSVKKSLIYTKENGSKSMPIITGEKTFFIICRNKDKNETEINLVKEVYFKKKRDN